MTGLGLGGPDGRRRSRRGKRYPGLYFQNTVSRVSFGNPAALSHLTENDIVTVEYWAKLKQFDAYGYVFTGGGNCAAHGYKFGFVPSQASFYRYAGGSGSGSGLSWPFSGMTANFHHYVYTYGHVGGNSLFRIGMDGLVRASSFGFAAAYLDDSFITALGSNNNTYSTSWQGWLTWIRVQLNDPYGLLDLGSFETYEGWPDRGAMPDPDANTLLHLPLDEGEGDTVIDYSGNGFNGTLVQYVNWDVQ